MHFRYDTFSAFGGITQTPKIMRDPDTGLSFFIFPNQNLLDRASLYQMAGMSKGFGFVSFDSFEVSSNSIALYLLILMIILAYSNRRVISQLNACTDSFCAIVPLYVNMHLRKRARESVTVLRYAIDIHFTF